MNIQKTLVTAFFTIIASVCLAQVQVVDRIVAVVGSKIVMKSDVENQYNQYLSQGNIANNNIKCRIVDQLMLNRLMLNQAVLDSVVVTDEQVESELDKKIRYFVSQIGSEKKLEEYFKKSIVEIKAEYKDLLKDQLLAQAMQSKITKDITATPSDVRAYYSRIPVDSLPNLNAEIEVSQITKKAPFSHAEIKAVKDKLEDIKARVAKGEDFGTMAVLYSEDPGSAKKSGDLGFVGRGELVPEFEAIAYSLKPNEISNIVETQFGYHIIQMIERRGNEINVRHILLKPKILNEDLLKAKASLDSIDDLIKSGKITFADAAQKYSDDAESKNNGGLMLNPQTGSSKFETDQMDPTLYFQIDKMKVGEMSAPLAFQTADGKQGFRLVLIKSKIDAHKANLKDDYQKIQTVALSEKQNNAINDWVEKKRVNTYIQINDEYKDCEELKDWIANPNTVK
jgi:peptidyl-prolyl cis-trans isomerase SurA